MTRPTIQELAEALRELHDFAAPDTHFRYRERSIAAFRRAAELLKRVEPTEKTPEE